MLPRGVKLIVAIVAVGALPAVAQDDPPQPPTSPTALAPVREITPEATQAIEDGIAWLARAQRDRIGSWPSKNPRYAMSVTALSGLALLAHGDTPDAGRYAPHLKRCLTWILDSQERWAKRGRFAGLIYDGENPQDREERPMHGHGFALLLLAEAYGQTRDPLLRRRLHAGIAAGVRLTEQTISADGGWYYYPGSVASQVADEGSVTITQIQALRAARNAGVHVDPVTIRRAVDYVKASQQSDGGVRYTLRYGDASAALTAAGIAVLHGAGEYHSDAIERAYAYLRQNLTTDLPDRQDFFFYTHLYAAQAMFQRGGAEWAAYLPRIRRELLELRHGAPFWDSHMGKSYGTAISLLILQLPLRYLPIYQR